MACLVQLVMPYGLPYVFLMVGTGLGLRTACGLLRDYSMVKELGLIDLVLPMHGLWSALW